MATKSKNTNVIVKIISILLSVVLMGAAAHQALQVLDYAMYYNLSPEEVLTQQQIKTLADCALLQEYLKADMATQAAQLKLQDEEAVKTYLEKNREIEVGNALKAYNERKAEIQEMYEAAGEAELDGEYFYFNEIFSYENSGIDFIFDINDGDNINFNMADEQVAAAINQCYDNLVNNYQDNTNCLLESRLNAEDFLCYLVDTKSGLTAATADDITPQELMKMPYSFAVIKGVPTYGKGFQGLYDNHATTKTGALIGFDESVEYYVAVDMASDASSHNLHSYSYLINHAKKIADFKAQKAFIIAAIMALCALVLGICSLVICGKRMKTGKVKRAWMDYIPTDVHLILTSAAIIGLGFLCAYVLDDVYTGTLHYSELVSAGVAAAVALAWGLVIENLTSFIRVCKSEKKFYQNLLVYQATKWLVVKPCAFLIKKLKAAHSYQPNQFKKVLIRGLIGYGFANLFALMVIGIAAGDGSVGAMAFVAIVLIGADIAGVVFVVRYLVQLDKIITAAHNRTLPQVDYAKLPNSLKVLVNSLNYSRQELQEAVNKAVRDERMRTELITNVSHDLKTPLTSIINYVDLLKGCDIQDESAREYIAVLDEKGSKLKRLIDDLIEASKATSGAITLHPVNLNLNELAAQAIVERQQEFADNNLELVFKGDKSMVTAFADGNKTFRILENLISNAQKYSAKGTRVYCDVYETQNFSIFEIKNISARPLDISPEELTQRFVRGDKARTDGGNGLGLSIADNLCKAQNGHLNITIDGDLFKAQVMLPKAK